MQHSEPTIPIRHINFIQLINDSDNADAIVSTFIKCACNNEDDHTFIIPHEDITLLLNMALESLRKSQDNIALC